MTSKQRPSHSGRQTFKLRVLAPPCSLWGRLLGELSLLVHLRWPWVPCGLWLHGSTLCSLSYAVCHFSAHFLPVSNKELCHIGPALRIQRDLMLRLLIMLRLLLCKQVFISKEHRTHRHWGQNKHVTAGVRRSAHDKYIGKGLSYEEAGRPLPFLLFCCEVTAWLAL